MDKAELNSQKEPEVTSAPEATPPTPTPKSQKSRKKLITILVSGFLALGLIIGFIVFMIIKNQPQNIALESFSNLMNARKVAVSGTVDIDLGDDSGIGPIAIKIDSASANSNQSANLGISVNQPESDEAIELEFGEVMMDSGVFYIKASGLKKIYENIISGMLDSSQTSTYLDDDYYSLYDVCDAYEDIDEYVDCLDQIDNQLDNAAMMQDPATISAISESKDQIEKIIQKIDDQWFEISVEDILNSDLVSNYIDQSTKDELLKTYQCTIDVQGNMPSYTKEFVDLYKKNQFTVLTPDKDSYYKVSLDAESLANYINAIPQTKFVSDISACSDTDLSETEIDEISASDIKRVTSQLPDVYAKFSGFFSHRLSGVKFNYKNSGISISSNLSFSYPANLEVNAPENAKPIMDLVEEFMQEM